MPLMYDFKCSECGEVKEYLVKNSDDVPNRCFSCSSTSSTFTKQVCYGKGGLYGLPMSSNIGHVDKYK